MDFATQMRARRAVLGLSQEEVAVANGMAPGTISRLENGENSTLGTIKTLEEFYKKMGAEAGPAGLLPQDKIVISVTNPDTSGNK